MHPVSDGGYLFRNNWGMLIEGFVDSMKVFSSFFEVFLWVDYQIVNFVLRNIGFVDSRG